ncbi:MAG TPA: hypothetical protein VM537_07815 [Anaerolineae bacterium]|nr:hypothetical protein [Anaerolineae bacterium]
MSFTAEEQRQLGEAYVDAIIDGAESAEVLARARFRVSMGFIDDEDWGLVQRHGFGLS